MFRLLASLALMAACAHAQYDYADVMSKSILFYEAQRSGDLPDNNRIPWRGDAFTDDSPPGGYHDAGDNVKFGFPMAAFTTQLAWGAITWQDAYSGAGEQDNLKATLKWSTDYFIACFDEGASSFTGQCGDGDVDHGMWNRPEDEPGNRPAFKLDNGDGGSDLLGETAAALASSSIYYRAIGDASEADRCVNVARQLFTLADQNRGVYTDHIPAGAFYNSWSGYNDELAWGAIWMYKATGEQSYLDQAKSFYSQFNLNERPSEFGWDNKVAGVQALLSEAEGGSYTDDISTFINYVLNEATYTPQGLIYIDQWGTLRHAGNIAHLCGQVAEMGIMASECTTFVENQIGYMLGDTGRSYVCGYGTNPPQKPHHRASSCPSDLNEPCSWDHFNSPDPNPNVLTGALVGGPDQNDQYTDDRGDYIHNEVTTDYNAGFQSALAFLVSNGRK